MWAYTYGKNGVATSFSPAQSSSGRGMAIGSKLKRTKPGMCQDKTAHIQANPSVRCGNGMGSFP